MPAAPASPTTATLDAQVAAVKDAWSAACEAATAATARADAADARTAAAEAEADRLRSLAAQLMAGLKKVTEEAAGGATILEQATRAAAGVAAARERLAEAVAAADAAARASAVERLRWYSPQCVPYPASRTHSRRKPPAAAVAASRAISASMRAQSSPARTMLVRCTPWAPPSASSWHPRSSRWYRSDSPSISSVGAAAAAGLLRCRASATRSTRAPTWSAWAAKNVASP